MPESFSFTEKVLAGSDSTTQVNTITADQRLLIDAAVAIGADQLFALTVDVSQVRGLYILSDKALTLETNSPSAPAQTLTLVANIPYIWYTGKYHALVFTTDITALYISNASGAVANLYMDWLIDPTI